MVYGLSGFADGVFGGGQAVSDVLEWTG